MKESFGATFNLTALFVFVVLITGFILFGMNYYRAFSVKNKIVTTIEEYEGNLSNVSLKEEIDSYIKRSGYHIPENNLTNDKNNNDLTCILDQGWCYKISRVTKKVDGVETKTNTYIYKVKTFVNMNIPIFNKFFTFSNFFSVTGETKPVKRS